LIFLFVSKFSINGVMLDSALNANVTMFKNGRLMLIGWCGWLKTLWWQGQCKMLERH